MSKAWRETKWTSRSTRCAGQIRPPVQRRTTSPGGRTAWLPQAGQVSGKANGLDSRRAPIRHHGDDLRDHVASPLQHHGVADADVLAGDLVLVVQCGPAHHDAADIHRLQLRHGASARRCGRPGCRFRAGWWSPVPRGISRRWPSAAPGRRSPGGAASQAVELVDDAVDVVAEAGPLQPISAGRLRRIGFAPQARDSGLTSKPQAFRRSRYSQWVSATGSLRSPCA